MPKQQLKDSYIRTAKVVEWEDGDSLKMEVDLGQRVWGKFYYRLYGVNTPKKGLPNYKESCDFVNKIAPAGTIVTIRTYKNPEKYGRWLCDVFVGDSTVSINQQLIAIGLGREYFGEAKSD